MRSPTRFLVVGAGAAAATLALCPVTAHAKVVFKGNTGTLFTQTVLGNNSGSITNSDATLFTITQLVGALTNHGNSGEISETTGPTDQEIGSTPGTTSSNNDGDISKSHQVTQRVGLTDLSSDNEASVSGSSFIEQSIESGFFLGLPGSHNDVTITNSSVVTQAIDGASSNQLTMSGVDGGVQIVVGLDPSDTVTHNALSARGFDVGQTVEAGDPLSVAKDNELTATNTQTTVTAEIAQFVSAFGGGTVSGNELGARGDLIMQEVSSVGGAASHNDLDAKGSNITETVRVPISGTASKNSISVTDSTGTIGDSVTITGAGTGLGADRNSVTVSGDGDSVTITAATLSASDNTVKITGNDDTVTLTDLSHQHVTIRGSGITCSASC